MRQVFRSHAVARGTLLLSAFALVVASGCKDNRSGLTDEQAEKGMGLPDSSSSREKITFDPRCELNEKVVETQENTPEWVIQQLLAAASSEKDDEESFQKFYSHFDASQAESWVRAQFWPRARTHASKYLPQDANAGIVYTICERRDEGDGKVKIFIQSNDPSKSNPPSTFKKDDAGKWKVVFYTP